nr:chorismate synthase [Tissierella sp.]
MSSIWGNNIKISLFGESHGQAVGVNIDGLPAGIHLDLESIEEEMARRAPGRDNISTSRIEEDKFEILSGYFNEKTTGTPLCAIIKNKDSKSKDYEKNKNLLRPGHADFTGNRKYYGNNDYRGGGHFSGRMTAPICFAGALAKQILQLKGIIIGSHIKSIYNIEDSPFNDRDITPEFLSSLKLNKIQTIDKEKKILMEEVILKAKEEGDSVGGVVELAIINLPPGIGSPFFNSVESNLSQMMFSIPGVKGVEFGRGFDITRIKGSQANDEFYAENGEIKTYTNNSGGILGGITNGMPIIFRVALKPTPSIGKVQKTVDIADVENKEIKIEGRHDPCIVVRAVPVLEGAAAIVLLDLLMEMNKDEEFRRSEIRNRQDR